MKRQIAGLLAVASIPAFAFLVSTHAATNGTNTLTRPGAAAARIYGLFSARLLSRGDEDDARPD